MIQLPLRERNGGRTQEVWSTKNRTTAPQSISSQPAHKREGARSLGCLPYSRYGIPYSAMCLGT